MIDIIYLGETRYGGWITFLEHLCRQVDEYNLFLVGERIDLRRRLLGTLEYRTVTPDVLQLRDTTKMLVVGVDYNNVWMLDKMKGATLVLRSMREVEKMPSVKDWPKIITLRTRLQSVLPKAKFIHLPFCREYTTETFDGLIRETSRNQLDPQDREMLEHPKDHPWNAVCFSRIDSGKNTELICEANDKGAEIQLFGYMNRTFVRREVNPKYPGWSRHWWGRFPHAFNAGVVIAQEANWVVDLSVAPDGGEIQYTFLEAWSAGRLTILHEHWKKGSVNGIVGWNSTFVQSVEELWTAVTCPPNAKPMVDWSLFETGKEFVDVIQG